MSNHTIEERHKLHQSRIAEAKDYLTKMNVDFKTYNEDMQFNIMTKRGLFLYYPTTKQYVLGKRSGVVSKLDYLYKILRTEAGLLPTGDTHQTNLRTYVLGNLGA